MHPIPPNPSRRAVLRAASASLAALAIVSAASFQANAASATVLPRDTSDAGAHLPGPPDHRHIVGLL